MSIYTFALNIDWNQFQAYYRGSAQMVVCHTDNGMVLHIHARHFRPFLRRNGVCGRFQLTLDRNGKVEQLVSF